MPTMTTVAFRRNPRAHLVVVLVTGLNLVSGLAAADADAEREFLSRLIHEIEVLTPIIQSAESHSIPEARIRFRYDWLRQDLERIRSGIQAHIDAPRTEPRTFPPLRGDYR